MSKIKLLSINVIIIFSILIFFKIELKKVFSKNIQLTHKFKTNVSESFGFLLYSQFITSYQETKDLNKFNVWISNSIYQEFFKIISYPKQSLTILTPKNNTNTSFLQIYDNYIGDSDTIYIGDTIHIGEKKGQILFKRSICDPTYLFECFIANIPYDKSLKNQTVQNSFGKIIGFYIQVLNGIIIPINSIKKLLLDNLDISKKRILQVNKNDKAIKYDEENSLILYDDKIRSKHHINEIIDIKMDAKMNIYTLDPQFKQLQKFNLLDSNGEYSRNPKIITFDNLINPISFDIAKNHFVYILDNGQKAILILNTELQLIHRISYKKLNPLIFPKKIYVYKDGLLILTEHFEVFFLDKIQNSKNILIKWYKNEVFKNNITDLTIDKDEKVYVLNKKYENEFLIQEIYPSNRLEQVFKIKDGLLKEPKQLYIKNESFYVIDLENEEYLILKSNGKLIKKQSFKKIDKIQKADYYFIPNDQNIHLVAYNYPSEIRILDAVKEDNEVFSISSLSKIYHQNSDIQNIQKCYSFYFENEKLHYLCQGENILKDNTHQNFSIAVSIGTKEKENQDQKKEDQKKQKDQNQKNEALEEKQNTINNDEILDIQIHTDQIINKVAHLKNETIQIDSLNKKILFKRNGEIFNSIDFETIGYNTNILEIQVLNDTIFLLDKANSKMIQINPEGIIQNYFFIKNSQNHILDIQDFTLTSQGEFLILSRNEVFIYGLHGNLLKFFEIKRNKNENIIAEYAKGISYLKDYIYIIDYHSPYLLKYSKNGIYMEEIDLGSHKNSSPIEIKTFKDHLFILDATNYQIMRYKPNESY